MRSDVVKKKKKKKKKNVDLSKNFEHDSNKKHRNAFKTAQVL